MKITRLAPRAFGCFSRENSVDIPLAPRLNVLYGPNEAGKSTLQQFIRGMLFGFKRFGTKRRYPLPQLDQYRPWRGDEYAGILCYEHDGVTYRVERDFERDETRIYDDVAGDDVTNQFDEDARRERCFALEHLGLNERVFDNTISIAQLSARTDSELAAEVKTHLANLASTGSTDLSVEKALEVLDGAIRELGTSRTRVQRIDRTEARLRELKEERAASEELDNRLRQAVSTAESRRLELEDLTREYRRIRTAELTTRVQFVEQRRDRARRVAAELESLRKQLAPCEDYLDFPVQLKDEVSRLDERLQEADRRKKEGEQELGRLQNRLAEALARVQELPDLGGTTDDDVALAFSRFDRLQDVNRELRRVVERTTTLESELRELDSRLAKLRGYDDLDTSTPPVGRAYSDQVKIDETTASLRHNEEELQRLGLELEAEQRAQTTSVALICLGGLLAVFGALGGVAWNPWGFAAAALGGALAAICLVRRGRARASHDRLTLEKRRVTTELANQRNQLREWKNALASMLEAVGADTLVQLEAGWDEYGRLRDRRVERKEEYQELLSRRAELEARRDEFTEALEGQLTPLDCGGELTLSRLEEYRSIWRKYRDLHSRAEQLREQIGRQENEIEQLDALRDQVKTRLHECLAQADVGDLAEFAAACDKHEQAHSIHQAIVTNEAELQGLIGEATLDDFDQELQELRSALTDTARDVDHDNEGSPAGPVTERQVKVLTSQREAIEDKRSELMVELERLEGDIEHLQQQGRELAEIDEDIEAGQRSLESLLFHRRALRHAHDTLQELAAELHREFAPELNDRVAEVVARVTAGRYDRVRITEELDIHVLLPETGTQKPLDALSGGTIDQLYFATRLAIAELVTGRTDLPLILDDSFIQYDESRLRRALELMTELSNEHQILLFTCQRRELELLDEMNASYKLIELEAL